MLKSATPEYPYKSTPPHRSLLCLGKVLYLGKPQDRTFRCVLLFLSVLCVTPNTMTTISQEINQLERVIHQTLTNHREHLTRQEEQMKCLTQLLNSRQNGSLDAHCLSAMNRLIELLNDRQSTDRVHTILNSLTQAKDATDLTIDEHGEVAAVMKLELADLAQRLQIEPPSKLSAATNNPTAWAQLMAKHADPDGYKWQLPGFKRGFYHKTHLQVTGTKAIKLAPGSSLN
jgi:hypothetical protein